MESITTDEQMAGQIEAIQQNSVKPVERAAIAHGNAWYMLKPDTAFNPQGLG